jgi:hypothetical protein
VGGVGTGAWVVVWVMRTPRVWLPVGNGA